MRNFLSKLNHKVRSYVGYRSKHRYELVGPSELWQMKREFQFKFLINHGLLPKHYLLDIGCGTLRGGIPLIDYLEKSHYFGIESRNKVLLEARKELKEAALEAKEPHLMYVPSISNFKCSQKFEFIWAFSVLIHMNDYILQETLNFISEHLSDNGVFYTNVNIGNSTIEGEWQEFPVVWRTFNFYESMCENSNLKVTNLGAIKNFGHISNIESQDSQQMLQIVSKSKS